ncbi:Gfo/Idh/MocA family protein [Pandoraea sp.]|uniref:Gfo/Idh/MocA family protein n=1 Tax=Pandoraea sp. TaxID=1883445 RepID=UPI0035B4AA05
MIHKRIRIGVLGCAKIARRSVIPAIRELGEEYELKAVASRTSAKAVEFACEFACEAIVGYENIVNREDIDALYIPLPTGMHYEWISKAIAAGKHVYAEKSFSSTSAETQSLISSAASKSVALMEGYMFLYHKQQEFVSNLIREGELGELRHFCGHFGFPPLPSDDFRYNEDLGGGVLMDAAGYPLRAARYFLGESLAVQAASIFRDPRKSTSLWGSAYLSNGAGLGASIAFGFDNAYQCRYEIWGSKGRIMAERAYTPGPTFSPRLVFEGAAGPRIVNIEPDNHFVGAMREFRRLIVAPARRQDHYRHILNQSIALEQIKTLSTLGLIKH